MSVLIGTVRCERRWNPAFSKRRKRPGTLRSWSGERSCTRQVRLCPHHRSSRHLRTITAGITNKAATKP
jgi:hypothetical protein